eukprot:COSAG06_NODE_1650_length_8805_cov_12.762807_2_plen_60_part_00
MVLLPPLLSQSQCLCSRLLLPSLWLSPLLSLWPPLFLALAPPPPSLLLLLLPPLPQLPG